MVARKNGNCPFYSFDFSTIVHFCTRWLYIFVRVSVYVCICMCMCVHAYLRVYVYVCVTVSNTWIILSFLILPAEYRANPAFDFLWLTHVSMQVSKSVGFSRFSKWKWKNKTKRKKRKNFFHSIGDNINDFFQHKRHTVNQFRLDTLDFSTFLSQIFYFLSIENSVRNRHRNGVLIGGMKKRGG